MCTGGNALCASCREAALREREQSQAGLSVSLWSWLLWGVCLLGSTAVLGIGTFWLIIGIDSSQADKVVGTAIVTFVVCFAVSGKLVASGRLALAVPTALLMLPIQAIIWFVLYKGN